MRKLENIKANIDERLNLSKIKYYDADDFIDDAKTYIKAIEQGRMACIIDSVSASGMSRTLRFVSSEKRPKWNEYYFRNYYAFFMALGYTKVKDSDFFRIHGCGMDMVFHTNYTNIHDLQRLGFLSKAQCSRLAQKTPVCL